MGAMTIKTILLKNFKQFEHLTISCRALNVLVGPNNAGKSTALDALRICSDVLRFMKRRRPTLQSQDGFGVVATFQIDESSISIPTTNIVRDYGDDEAKVIIIHENGNELHVLLHPDKPIISFLSVKGPIPRSADQIRRSFPVNILVVPTLGPFESRENFVTDDTVRKNEGGRLAHRHFRNIWHRKTDEEFDEFSQFIGQSWPGVTISKPSVVTGLPSTVEMYFSEDRREREVAWSGFGFQIWMQIITHILRGNKEAILVLDEPDIYLHPDLQRKLMGIVSGRFGQVFIATHSAEIINRPVAEVGASRRWAGLNEGDSPVTG